MSISIDSLKRAVSLAEQIEGLKAQLASILGQTSSTGADPTYAAVKTSGKRRGRPPGKKSTVVAAVAAKPAARKKGKMSAAGRANIIAAQKARWAKIKGAKPAAKAAKPARKKGKMSAAGRAAIVAAQKARWAKVKAEKAKAGK